MLLGSSLGFVLGLGVVLGLGALGLGLGALSGCGSKALDGRQRRGRGFRFGSSARDLGGGGRQSSIVFPFVADRRGLR